MMSWSKRMRLNGPLDGASPFQDKQEKNFSKQQLMEKFCKMCGHYGGYDSVQKEKCFSVASQGSEKGHMVKLINSRRRLLARGRCIHPSYEPEFRSGIRTDARHKSLSGSTPRQTCRCLSVFTDMCSDIDCVLDKMRPCTGLCRPFKDKLLASSLIRERAEAKPKGMPGVELVAEDTRGNMPSTAAMSNTHNTNISEAEYMAGSLDAGLRDKCTG